MSAAASLLSQLTHFAGVVMTPKRREATFRHIEFLRLSDRRVLLIIVTSEGDVQNRILHTDRTYSQSQLEEATNFFNRHYAGQPYDAVRSLLAEELKSLREDIVGLMTAAVEVGGAALNEAEALVVTGEKNLLAAPTSRRTWIACAGCSSSSSRRPRSCTSSTSRSAREGVQIYIGGESGLVPLDECSVITAPYELDGRVIGTLGVIGPTRMAYERVIPIVDVTAKLLSNALTHQMND